MSQDRLLADFDKVFESGKVYTHAQGLSCCFRQWRAYDSHCRFLHGYALQVSITFRTEVLDDRNWVVNFGGLKEVKAWLEETFDHKTLIAKDDPQLHHFTQLSGLTDVTHSLQGLRDPVIQLRVVDHVGCEAFAKMIFEKVDDIIRKIRPHLYVDCVEVREHESNFARYRRNKD